jgi:hypothetical protein
MVVVARAWGRLMPRAWALVGDIAVLMMAGRVEWPVMDVGVMVVRGGEGAGVAGAAGERGQGCGQVRAVAGEGAYDRVAAGVVGQGADSGLRQGGDGQGGELVTVTVGLGMLVVFTRYFCGYVV